MFKLFVLWVVVSIVGYFLSMQVFPKYSGWSMFQGLKENLLGQAKIYLTLFLTVAIISFWGAH